MDVTFNWKGRPPAPAQSNRKTLIGLISIKIEYGLGWDWEGSSLPIFLKSFCWKTDLNIAFLLSLDQTWPDADKKLEITEIQVCEWKRVCVGLVDEQTGARIDGGDPTGRSGLPELLGGKPTQEDNINGSGAIREQSKTKKDMFIGPKSDHCLALSLRQ